jgi:hypothetical protein
MASSDGTVSPTFEVEDADGDIAGMLDISRRTSPAHVAAAAPPSWESMPVMTLGEGAWDDLDALLDSVAAAVDEDAAACHAGLFDEDVSVNQLPCAASLFM